MVYTFVPRVIQTYNCDGYKIYKILTQNPTYITNISIDSTSVVNADYMYNSNSIIMSNYSKSKARVTNLSNQDLADNVIKDIKAKYSKYNNCKAFDVDLIVNTSETTYTEFCYLLNRTNKGSYPECSKEIKAKFEMN